MDSVDCVYEFDYVFDSESNWLSYSSSNVDTESLLLLCWVAWNVGARRLQSSCAKLAKR